MGQTPDSSLVSYLSPTEFTYFKDVRAIGQLAMDDGTQATLVDITTNARVGAILLAASGEIESALVSSGRYSSSDLSQPNGASQQFLKQLVADIAMYRMYTARDAPEPPATVLASYDQALQSLELLRSGKNILTFKEVIEAGIPIDVFMNQGDYMRLNRFSDSCHRTLGLRQDRKTPGF